MMTIGDRIRVRREELHMTQLELANKIGYKSKASINKIELSVQNLKQSKIKAIADALDTTPAYIMGWEDVKNEPAIKDSIIEIPKGIRIPVLGEVAAGQPILAEDNCIGYMEISDPLSKTGDFFGLKIKGDSMSPRISEGDIVIVKQQEYAESGDVVIVLINGDSATCKQLMKNRDGISLHSFNPIYAPMEYSNEEIMTVPVRIIGKVVENRQIY